MYLNEGVDSAGLLFEFAIKTIYHLIIYILHYNITYIS